MMKSTSSRIPRVLSNHIRIFTQIILLTAVLVGLVLPAQRPVAARPDEVIWNYEIAGPAGSGSFGDQVYALPNGNFVVVDMRYSAGGKSNLGAVYLYDGQTRALISTLAGEHADDYLGSARIMVLNNSNFVVISPYWDNDSIQNAGAATFCSGTTGCPAQISAANSLVGASTEDLIGYAYNSVLKNGWYFIGSTQWDNGSSADAGAFTFCSGETGCAGEVSALNSVVGSHQSDAVGTQFVRQVSDQLLVVESKETWNSDTVNDAGALTFCEMNNLEECRGVISDQNSLVGIHPFDFSHAEILPLATGNWLVRLPNYGDVAGADTGALVFCTSILDCTGEVPAANMLPGILTVSVLSNGSYAIANRDWTNGSTEAAGAVRWCDGTTGCSGEFTAENSLVGSTQNDRVGLQVVVLPNSRYLVASPEWDGPTVANAGAVTWCEGDGSCKGLVTSANSLVGASISDQIGSYDSSPKISVIDDAYLVISPLVDHNSTANVGAVTWCSASSGCQGEVSPANSLMGSSAEDGSFLNIYARSGETHYMAVFSTWDSPTVVDAGAVTWCPVDVGCKGILSVANSLIGSHANDRIGERGAFVLAGGSLVVSSEWNGTAARAGAISLCSVPAGCPGVVSEANSLVGSHPNDRIGLYFVLYKEDGYSIVSPTGAGVAVRSSNWANANGDIVGAVSYCSVGQPCTGRISALNSLVGTKPGDLSDVVRISFSDQGDFTVNAWYWDNGTVLDAGASRWCDRISGCTGEITSANSRVGAMNYDSVSRGGQTYISGGEYRSQGGSYFLPNGQWVIYSRGADANGVQEAGALSVCAPGSCSGRINGQNSLLGSQYNQQLGQYPVINLSDGSFVIVSADFHQLLWCHGAADCRGRLQYHSRAIIAQNFGYDGRKINFGHDTLNNRLIVGVPMDNRVVIVLPEPPAVFLSLSSSANTALSGEAVTFTATLEATSGQASGSVAFSADGNPPVNVYVVNGTASFNSSFSTIGQHMIRAVFSGSGGLVGETAQEEILVSVTSPQVSLNLTSSQNPSLAGQQVTYTASASSSSGIPTGKVTFTINSGSAVVVDLVNGSATHTITFAEQDTYFVRAEYMGTGAFAGSSKVAQVTQTVNNLTVTVNLASSANPAAAGSEVTYTAVASSNNGTPTGSITFSVYYGESASVPLIDGVASYTTTFADEGTYFVEAGFSGTGAFMGKSAGRNLIQTISQTPVTLQLDSSQNPAPIGQPVTLTATASSTLGTPIGTMSFVIDGGTPVQVALDGGSASTTHTFNQAGTHLIQVTYTGMGVFAGNTASTSYQQVTTLPAATLSLSSSKNPSLPGEQITFTTTASSTSGTPTGTVSFRIDDFPPVPVALTNGTASFSYPFQETGSYAIHATFTGSGSFAGVTAEADLTQTVATVSPPTVSLQVTAPNGPVLAGQMVTFGVTATCSKGTPTGSVTVALDDGLPLSVELVNGAAEVSLRFAEPGQHTVKVSFSGSGEYAGVSADAEDVQQMVSSALFLPALIRQ